ncbi:MAG: hypothetical protein KY469_01080 [Actinobacteria bacterium]|nr:hypothetical protein [Actinomycetota bacterium]
MHIRTALVLLTVSALLLGVAPTTVGAAPSEHYITTVNFQYVPPQLLIESGDALTYVNADLAVHDVHSVDEDVWGDPLFSSRIIAQGQSAPVEGVEALGPGDYGFFCTTHPEMTGTLHVLPRTSPPLPVPVPPLPSVAAVATPTSIAVVGNNVLAASWAQGTVEMFPILAGGVLGPGETYASGFNNPLGIVVDDNAEWLYVADSHGSSTSGRTTAGRVWAIPAGGGDAAEVGQIVVDELPNGRHNTNGLAIRGDRLYITNGNSTDDGATGGDPETPLSGTLLSVRLGARDLGPEDAVFELEDPEQPLPELFVEATGMRNNFDVAFRPGTPEAWMTVNGLDEQDPYGEDTLVAVRDVDQIHDPPTHFGFPECVYADLEDGWDVAQNPAVEEECGEHTAPEQLLGLHVAATGLAFGPDGDLVAARFGNFFGDEPVGRDVVRIPIDDDGDAGEPETIVNLPAPIDVAFNATDLYVADFALGQILLLRAI